jgi:hypothetical protein
MHVALGYDWALSYKLRHDNRNREYRRYRRFLMTDYEKGQTNRVVWLCVALAVIAAIAYVMMALDILAVGDLQLQEAPPSVAYVAAGGYLLGGLLILLRRRWLWIVGAVINALVILFFFLGIRTGRL